MLVFSMKSVFYGSTTAYSLYSANLPEKVDRAQHVIREYASHVAWSRAERMNIPSSILRSQFKDLDMRNHRLGSNHTHPESAAERSSASTVIDAYGQRTGLTPYFIQCSQADWRNNRLGSRSYYWAKDLSVEPKCFDPPKDPINVLVDVDHYMDMPSFLARNFAPTLIYTFQPEVVAKSGKEYSFTFNANAEVDYKVSGGGSFTHQIWNYGTDHLLVTKKWLGIPICTVAYNVDHRRCGPDHQLILLAPLARWQGIMAIVSWLFAGKTLERLNPVHADKEHLRMLVHRTDGTFISTGRVGDYASATIKAEIDNTIATVARTSKIGLTLASVRSYVEEKQEAAALFSFHRTKQNSVMPVVFPVEDSVRRYQYIPKTFDDETKPSLKAFMSPLIHGAFAPDLCKNNEETCIQGRIKDVKSDAEITPFLNEVINEFCTLFFPTPNVLHLASVDEVYERQNRPSQRHTLETAGQTEPKRIVKMFQKKEAYTNVKDPRPISTINSKDKLDYSRVIYPLADYMKNIDWYAFGISPVETADRICKILAEADSATNSDFSRFDGHVSRVLRDLEQILLVRGFDKSFTPEILELHRSQFNLFAVGTYGTKYETGFARASGSPETSSFNSIANAFVAFLAFRKTRVNGVFLDAQQSWDKLGLYGGDDGLTADINPVIYVKAAAMVGQVLETELIKRGNFGITFLSRMYGPNVWFGDNNSCCDLPRQLSKLHTTIVLPAGTTCEEKLLEKARAYYLTDRNTPVLGQLVSKIVAINGEIHFDPKMSAMMRWNSDLPIDKQYPNRADTWLDDYAQSVLTDKLSFDFEMFNQWLSSLRTVTDCLSPPLCAEPVNISSKRKVVVDGDQFEPEKITTQASKIDVKNPRLRKNSNPKKVRTKNFKKKPSAIVKETSTNSSQKSKSLKPQGSSD